MRKSWRPGQKGGLSIGQLSWPRKEGELSIGALVLSDELKPLIRINIALKQNIIIIRQQVWIKNLPPK